MRRAAALVAVLLLAAGCVSGTGRVGPPPKRPNFVFVLADDLDDALLPYLPKTTRDVADQGVTLSRYYVNLSWCCPSRATTLRGQYAHNTSVWSNNPPNGGFQEFYRRGEEKQILATWLAADGYRNGLFGKYLNGYPDQVPGMPRTYIPPGWDTWVSPVAGHPFQGFDYTLNVDGKLVHRSPSPATYLTDVLAGEAKRFVTADDDRPFFAYIAPVTPHPPSIPAPRHAKLYPGLKAPRTPAYDASTEGKPTELRRLPPVTKKEERKWDALYRRRAQATRSIDDLVDSLVTALRAAGRLDDTYIIVTSDNGFHIGDYRMPPGKNTGYETDIRVPFLVRGPGIPAGRTVAALAGNTDIAPTLLDFAGARRPPLVDGRSLRRPLTTGRRPADWRAAFLLEHGTARNTRPAARYDGSGEPPDPYTPKTRDHVYLPVFTGVRTDRYLYLGYVTGERELYDLETDPYQLRNLAADDPAVVRRLAAWAERLRTCAGSECRTEEARPPSG
ncbi:sulfatase family protein [Actinomadura atramentaria]|uniref:sulfatase family protein n=1 Tax=Actinomadura atramentaria TaxID=1990 RepID=UPI000366EEE5|nr:sulfatase [Actinomadura atramentaria]